MSFKGSKRGREVVRALEKAGWTYLRTTGSHRVFARRADRYVFPFSDSDEIGQIMLNRIARKTGIGEEHFR